MFKQIGEFKHYTSCRFCSSLNLIPVINLGYVPLAGGFIKKTEIKNIKQTERFYPLELCFCSNCYLLQTNNVISRDTLFKDYYYYSSAIKTLVGFFESISLELQNLYSHTNKRFIVEIGCNDGTLLKLIEKKGFKVLGIDPAANIVKPLIKKGFPIINDYFSENLGKQISSQHGKADVIISFNTLAHIEDMHDVIRGTKILLKKDGFLTFGVHYLGNLIEEVQYDMIYHEHQYYYSFMALKKLFDMHNMEIYDVKSINIHAGSMVYYVQNKKYGKRKISKNVKQLIKKEEKLNLHKIETYLFLSKRIQKTKNDLIRLLVDLKNKNKSIVGYGASGRGTTIMNYCGLTKEIIDYVVDDAPAKHGKFAPGTHHLIYPSSMLDGKKRPDYVILFAWPFIDEIKKRKKDYLKNGGKFIVPLPRVKIVAQLPCND